jgi:hypothetical protein
MKPFVMAIAVVLSLGGCAQIDQIPDDTLQRDLQIGARQASSFALRAALRKFPNDVQKITADANIALDILNNTLIPAFSGASTADVVRGVLDTALAQLKAKLTDPRVIEVADISVEFILVNVKLPPTLTAKLDERTRKILLGIFTGLSDGIKAATAAAPAPARAPLTIPQNP